MYCWWESALHEFFELFEGDASIAVIVGLLDHVADVVIGHFLAHSGEHFLEAFEGDGLFGLGVEDAEGLEHILFGGDGEHHPILGGEGYLAMRAMNSPS